MQAILLSAGRGQRLAPKTDSTPKPLVKVADKALIDYQLEKLSDAGIKKVIINTGWLGQQLIDYVGTGKRYGLRVLFSVEPENALETAGGIIQALPLVTEETFIVCNADVFHEYDFASLTRVKLDSSEAHLVLINNPKHNPAGDFSLQSGCVMNRSESENLSYTYSGIGLFAQSFFAGLSRGRRGLGDLLRAKAESGLVSGQTFTGVWFDAGTQSRLDEIESYVLTNLTGGSKTHQ